MMIHFVIYLLLMVQAGMFIWVDLSSCLNGEGWKAEEDLFQVRTRETDAAGGEKGLMADLLRSLLLLLLLLLLH